MSISVVKGHAYGNDFLLVPESDLRGADPVRLAQARCHRLEGIGADGSVSRSPEEFAALVRSDTARYAKIVKDIGLKID